MNDATPITPVTPITPPKTINVAQIEARLSVMRKYADDTKLQYHGAVAIISEYEHLLDQLKTK